MDLYGLIIFFSLMLVLAAIPSGSVGFVVVSSATRGLGCGIAAALGIVAGDLIFVSLALLGLTALAETMGALFAVFRYLGGAYLIWVGIKLILSAKNGAPLARPASRMQWLGTFNAALLLTLGDWKAILFYASLFPLCVDMQRLSFAGVVAIVSLTVVAVGGVKLIYALLARRIAARLQSGRWRKGGRTLAGAAMIGAGGFVIAKS